MPTVAIDFDGTLVGKGSWPECGTWQDGAQHALRTFLKQKWTVIVHSCRANWPEGLQQIREMLDAAGLQKVDVWTKPGKPIAMAYIDDRAVPFAGNWHEAYRAALSLKER